MRDAAPSDAADADRGILSYRYLSIGSAFARADLPIATLIRRAWAQRHRFLGEEGKRMVRRSIWLRWAPDTVVDALSVTRMAARFLAARTGFRRGRTLTLPVRGDFALDRKSGAVKLLDVGASRVYTLMLNAHDADKLRGRIAYARGVEAHAFAPDVYDVELERGYFSEAYLSGTRPKNFRGCFDAFETSYLGLLVDFLRAEPPEMRRRADYAAELRHAVLGPEGLARRLPDDDFERVRRRVDASATVVEAAGDSVPLVLSHGDFFSGNIVVSGDVAHAIDWAHVGRRSPLHDLYYVTMNHCVRVLEPPALHERFREMLETLRDRLQREDPDRFGELAPWLVDEATGRHLFYLECIEVPLTRCARPDDRYIAAMLQRLDWFDAFEASLDDRAADAR